MGGGVKLNSVGQIHISVQDLTRTVRFYRDVLGMTLLFEVPEQEMAFFDCGGIRLYLGKAEGEDFRSNPLIYYNVSAISETFQTLLERGAGSLSEPHIVHSTEAIDLWIAGITDPDGNAIMLMSEVAR